MESLVVFCSVTEVRVQTWAEQRRWPRWVILVVAEQNPCPSSSILGGLILGLGGPTRVIEVMLVYHTENFWYQVLW
jgi:hypothetical protein